VAILNRIPKDRIREEFTHYGLFCGFVPVYVKYPHGICTIAVRNWWPEWLMSVALFLVRLHADMLPPGERAPFPVFLTGRIDGSKEPR
jgi:hypothetical protein